LSFIANWNGWSPLPVKVLLLIVAFSTAASNASRKSEAEPMLLSWPNVLLVKVTRFSVPVV
jgi:hypothetical protein